MSILEQLKSEENALRTLLAQMGTGQAVPAPLCSTHTGGVPAPRRTGAAPGQAAGLGAPSWGHAAGPGVAAPGAHCLWRTEILQGAGGTSTEPPPLPGGELRRGGVGRRQHARSRPGSCTKRSASLLSSWASTSERSREGLFYSSKGWGKNMSSKSP